MANYNKVILVGNLTRDPEVRYTPNGAAVMHCGIAVNRSWRSQDGEDRQDTCFIDLTAWGRRGEIISEYKSKGDPILIEGRLRMESWQGQDGQKRTKHVVVVENFQFLDRGGRAERPPRQPPGGQPQQAPPPPEEEPQSGAPDDAFGGDDIPF
jgi:single-strand DNA-binding protein